MIQIKSNEVYLDRELRPERGETPENSYHQGRPPGLDLTDHDLESHEHRRHFQDGEGDISIVVEAGDELGDIGVCLQYEGQIADYSGCIAKQNDLIHDAAGWLAEILSQFETDWDAEVVSAPCPKADEKLDVHASFERLRQVEVESHVSAGVARTVEKKVKV